MKTEKEQEESPRTVAYLDSLELELESLAGYRPKRNSSPLAKDQ